MNRRIAFTREDGVARLLFDAPERRNAIDLAFCQAWAQSAHACAADATLKLIRIEARGDIFSVGGDLAAFADNASTLDQYTHDCVTLFHEGILALQEASAPVLLALGGVAAGGAFSLACGADFVIASRSAKLVSGYTRTGLTPDGGLTYLLPRLVGPRRAFEIIANNTPISADEALELGIVSQVVDDVDFDAAVEHAANGVTMAPPGVLEELKRLLRISQHASFADQLAAEAGAIVGRAALEDTKHRQRSFLKQ